VQRVDRIAGDGRGQRGALSAARDAEAQRRAAGGLVALEALVHGVGGHPTLATLSMASARETQFAWTPHTCTPEGDRAMVTRRTVSGSLVNAKGPT
jgi:hypothetical protein